MEGDESTSIAATTCSMKIEVIDSTLQKLEQLIRSGQFEELETDSLEFKAVPAVGKDWNRVHESVCAFLNTRGGFLILGIKEEGQGTQRKYVFQGWRPEAENHLKELPTLFTDKKSLVQQLQEYFPPPVIRPFLTGQVAIQLIDELPADRKFVFYRSHAYQRHLTGDKKLSSKEIASQEEYKQEALLAQELQIVRGAGLKDLDLDKVNEYISLLNRPVKVETQKRDLKQARPFLERKVFLRENAVTLLGMVTCGKHPVDWIGFRAHVHGYVDTPHDVVKDKQDIIDNILQLMERGYAYLLRNIQVGVSINKSGSSKPQYPEQLLRETVNNALAHRDYSIDRQVILTIQPGKHISISNPGTFRDHLLIEDSKGIRHVARIIPEAKPRNPKLADVLRVYRKWEGRGIGMATMVNFCLQNQIDLPYYLFRTNEVVLHLCTGQLLDDRMERLFDSFDGYLRDKMEGGTLSITQKLVLSYLIKSEWANQQARYTILLTPDNNHFAELQSLEQHGLIEKHSSSTANYPVFVPAPLLIRRDFLPEVRQQFGEKFDELSTIQQQILSLVYRYERFSLRKSVTARIAAFSLWHEVHGSADDIKAFDGFYRKVKTAFNQLEKQAMIFKLDPKQGYRLNRKKRGSSMPLFPEGE